MPLNKETKAQNNIKIMKNIILSIDLFVAMYQPN